MISELGDHLRVLKYETQMTEAELEVRYHTHLQRLNEHRRRKRPWRISRRRILSCKTPFRIYIWNCMTSNQKMTCYSRVRNLKFHWDTAEKYRVCDRAEAELCAG